LADLNTVRASAPAGIVQIETLEILHDSFPAPIRLTNQLEDIDVTLEATAPLNAGQVVTFTAVPFALVLPRAGDGAIQTIDITISNLDQIASNYLETAIENPGPVTLIYRMYLSDDTSEPAENPPTRLELVSGIADYQQLVVKAKNADNISRKFPTIVYNIYDHPGLVR
jgi:hypothetical protein